MKHLGFLAVIYIVLVFAECGVSYAGNIGSGKAKSGACEKCHGVQGTSEDQAIPNLAGQQVPYLIQQLKGFKSGSRGNATMNGISAALTDADMEDLAAYYSSLKPSAGKGDSVLSARGKAKYNLCQDCHGPGAEGQGPIPRLSGQHPLYTVAQLKAYKDGTRKNFVMNGIARDVTEDDFKALAEYTFGLK